MSWSPRSAWWESPTAPSRGARLAVVLGGLLLAASVTGAATNVSGTLSGNLLWTTAGSPYRLVGDTTLAVGSSLTINPSVVVEAQGNYRFTVAGALTINATSATAVSFSARSVDLPGSWPGVWFTSTATANVTGANFSKGVTNVTVDGAPVTFNFCQFTRASQDGVFVANAATFNAGNCSFSSNGGNGLHLETPLPRGLVSDSTLNANGAYPALVVANCVDLLGPGLTYSGNTLQQVGVSCSAAVDVTRSQTWRGRPGPVLNLLAGASSDLTVGPGVTLTIQPPLTLVCGRITVQGTLICGDATGVVGLVGPTTTPGSWEGLFLQPGSVGQFTGARVKFATNGITCDRATLVMNNARVVLSALDGVRVIGSSQVNCNGPRLLRNGRYGLYLPDPVTGSVENALFNGNGDYPVFLRASNVGILGSVNQYSSNGKQAVGVTTELDPDVAVSALWHNQRVPYDTTARPGGGVLHIGPSAVLTLDPGVTMWSTGISVRGRLDALGVLGRPVQFQPPGGDPAGSWEGITFFPGASGRLRNGLIEGASVGVFTSDASPRLEYLTWRGCTTAALYCRGTAAPLVTNCRFTDNPGDGVRTQDAASPRLGDLSNADTTDDGGNVFWNNGDYDLRHTSSAALMAQNNWWGTASAATIGTRILDGNDTPGYGLVTFLPILSPGTNQAPTLSWTKEAGLSDGGVRPSRAPPTSMLEFRVKYTHPQGKAPRYVRVYLFRGDNPHWGSPFLMNAVAGGSYTTGKYYSVGMKLSTATDYSYRFEAEDGLLLAGGEATSLHSGPAINSVPTLAWTGEPGYTDGGVSPPTGVANDYFVWRVRYADADGQDPQTIVIHLRYGGTPVTGSPFPLVYKSGVAATGVIYALGRRMAAASYEYRFEATDGADTATGAPAVWHAGPSVSTGGAGLLGVVTAQEAAGGMVEIRCRLQGAAALSVRVLNIAGREVARVVEDQPREAGEQVVLWNRRSGRGARVPAGLYLVEVGVRGSQGEAAHRLAPLSLGGG